MKRFLIIFALLLSGCSNFPKKKIETTVHVDVPVRVACVDEVPVEPVYETSSLIPEDNLCRKVDALLIERIQRQIYTNKLAATLKGCEAIK